ncbi:MAG TPA: class I SAM-dependent methyltransferase [Candidatus Coatesbacteria bacterium]|nr:class I SAM-dependent methyltransferase [Candidatus Coatesbacteria bacterium]
MTQNPSRDRAKTFFTREEIPDGPLGRMASGRGLGLRRAVLDLERLRDAALGDFSGKRLLELGAGYGLELVQLALKGARAVGVDFSLTRLGRAPLLAESAGVSAAAVVGDCHDLPFRDGAFDVVYGNSILNHLNRPRSLNEIRRVLAPGGRLVVCEPLDRHPLLKPYRRRLKAREGVVSYLAYEELEADLLGGGYELQPLGLTSALLLPPAALGFDGPCWRGAARLLNRLDRFLFRKSAWAGRHAWVCLALYRGRALGR